MSTELQQRVQFNDCFMIHIEQNILKPNIPEHTKNERTLTILMYFNFVSPYHGLENDYTKISLKRLSGTRGGNEETLLTSNIPT